MAHTSCVYAANYNTELLLFELQALSAHQGEGLGTTQTKIEITSSLACCQQMAES